MWYTQQSSMSQHGVQLCPTTAASQFAAVGSSARLLQLPVTRTGSKGSSVRLLSLPVNLAAC
jgi:hypothetical protein